MRVINNDANNRRIFSLLTLFVRLIKRNAANDGKWPLSRGNATLEIRAKREKRRRVFQNYLPARRVKMQNLYLGGREREREKCRDGIGLLFPLSRTFRMRDFPDGSMRPRDFSAFSPVESGKRERVHATKARAYTRSRRTAAREETREGTLRRIGRQKWKRTVASRTRVSCGASTRCRGNNR